MRKHLFLICSSWLLLALQLVCTQSGQQAFATISPAAFQQELRHGKVILLDGRTPAEFAQDHLAGAVNLDF